MDIDRQEAHFQVFKDRMEKREGIITHHTRSAPSASTATAVESAESMPPESPSTTLGKRLRFT